MAKYDFDKVIDRNNTNSLKYDFKEKRGMPSDVLPLWVADMDFQTAPEIIDALISKSNHGIFGYSEPLDDYFKALDYWISKHFKWKADRKNFILVPGVVFGIANAINALTERGDSILINQPVYYPFEETILDNERKLVVSNLVYKNGKYEIDFIDLEKKIIDNNVKIYLLCNPHNPVGRVWRKDELLKIKEIANRNNVLVISDEIHADFIYKNYEFTSYANIDIENSIICLSSSKTFNLAGLHNGNIYIKNPYIRRRVRFEIRKVGYSQSNIMGIIANQTAYLYGEDWYNQLLEYIENNLNFVRDYLNKNLKKVKLVEPEGTYLIWLDFNGLNIDDKELNDIVINKAKLWLDPGNIFGSVGMGFQRINIACPRKTLEEALNRLKYAFKNIEGK